MLRIRSIRARLTLWYVSLLTVTLLLLGGVAYTLLSYSLSEQLDTSLKGIGKLLSDRIHEGNEPFVPSDIDEAFRRFFGFSPRERYFQMFEPPGRHGEHNVPPGSGRFPLDREALGNASHGLPTLETVEEGSEPYPVRLLTMPVMEGGRLVRLVQVGMSLQTVYETRTRFLLILAGLLPVGLLLAGMGGWLLARRALRPVDRMREAAERIGAEHLAERLEETGAGDELDRLAGTLNRMLGRLDAAFNQIRRFSADASHELQTPLTIMKGELEVALRAQRSAEEYQEVLRSSLEEIDRISHLVEGLLLLARSEAGALAMRREPVDLCELLEEICGKLKFLADSRSIALVLGPNEPVCVPGDRELLWRLFSNLVENGIKYTDPGGRVALSLTPRDGAAVVEIADTGRGIPEEDRERIFQPFYRTGTSLSEKGAGLGLAIARSIAAAHGGTIEAESEPGRGTTLRVRLPLAPS